MIYEPKVMYNPTSKDVEFMCDRKIYIFKPGEKRMLDGFVAHHVIRELNTPLKEYDPEVDGLESSGVAYDKMSWGALKKLGAEKGVFKPGMTKIELIEGLVALDEQGA